MEKQFNKNRQLDQWIKDVPLERAPSNFSQQVMNRLDSKPASSVYRPLIPKWGWAIVGFFMVALVLWAFWAPASENISMLGEWTPKVSLQNPFEGMSKTSVYAIGFMLLFLVQIPFLKRLLEKNHS